MVGIRVVCLPGGLEPGWGAGEQRELQIPDRQALVVWIDDHHHNNRRERSELEGEGVRFQLASTDEELMKMLEERQPIEHFSLLHTNSPEQAMAFHEQAAHLIPAEITYSMDITPVIGAHLGPGAVGYVIVSKKPA